MEAAFVASGGCACTLFKITHHRALYEYFDGDRTCTARQPCQPTIDVNLARMLVVIETVSVLQLRCV